jgi:hypothetical protein
MIRSANVAGLGYPERASRTRSFDYSLQTRSHSVGERLNKETKVKRQKRTKLVHEGQYLAEVDVEPFVTEDGWSPYLSIEDSYKLDDVREALRRGDVVSAAGLGREFALFLATRCRLLIGFLASLSPVYNIDKMCIK